MKIEILEQRSFLMSAYGGTFQYQRSYPHLKGGPSNDEDTVSFIHSFVQLSTFQCPSDKLN